MADKSKGGISKQALLLSALALVLLVLVIVFFTGGGGEKVKRFVETNVPQEPVAPAGKAAARTVTLFFVDEDDLLHKETREIPAGPAASDEAARALAELVRGSEEGFSSPLPPGTRVRQVFVTKDGVATVDFSREIVENFSYGSTAELAAVYAVVDTLVSNFPAVKRVVLLVEGAERETLGGHVDLSRAFLPDYSLVAK